MKARMLNSRPDTDVDEQQEQSGPLIRLLRAVGADDKLPPIPTVKMIDVMPVTVAVPVTASTPHARICPKCRIYEKEAHAPMCPRCALKLEIHAMNAAERQP